MSGNPYYVAVGRQERLPRKPLPPGSCDAHFHVIGPLDRFPTTNSHTDFNVHEALASDALEMHRQVGFDRGVFVQPSNYLTDNRAMVAALKAAPAGRYRGVAIIDDATTDAEMRDMTDAGVVGARFNFLTRLAMAPDPALFRRSVDRLRDHGWYAKVLVSGEQVPQFHAMLAEIKDVPVVIDHMARLWGKEGTEGLSYKLILDLLARPNFWMILSNAFRTSSMPTGWDDMVPIGQGLYRAAPDRCMFATDWPHANDPGTAAMEADLIAVFDRYMPDEAARQAVLVDNPARLHGFK